MSTAIACLLLVRIPDTVKTPSPASAVKGRFAAFNALSTHGPLTDFELAEKTGVQQTSIGKRRLELQHEGLVEPLKLSRLGEIEIVTRPAPSGNAATVWSLSLEGVSSTRYRPC